MRKSTDFSTYVPSEISIYGIPPSKGPADGYSYAGLQMALALKRLGIATPWRDDSSPASISFCQPDWYSQADKQFRIGYTPWESTKIPDWWKRNMMSMSMLWTTSRFCRDVFIDNGIDRDILVVPHGINTSDFSVSRRTYSEPFRFLHIGEPAIRKNGQMVVDAFIEVFGGDRSVELVMKANGFTQCRLRDPFGPIDRHPNITLITDTYSIQQMNALYLSCHALVYPSRGEGFGLIPFQAICTGMPTAAVVWSGIADFGEHCIPIKFEVVDSGHDYHIGSWAEPDFDSLCQVMLSIKDDYDIYAAAAYESAILLRETMTWDGILTEALLKTFSCQVVD